MKELPGLLKVRKPLESKKKRWSWPSELFESLSPGAPSAPGSPRAAGWSGELPAHVTLVPC